MTEIRSKIWTQDENGSIFEIDCITITPQNPGPRTIIINGQDQYFMDGAEVKLLGNGRYETSDGRILVEF